MSSRTQDRVDIERVFSTYLRSLEEADVALASQVTPIGRFTGWDGVKEIWARTEKEFSERGGASHGRRSVTWRPSGQRSV